MLSRNSALLVKSICRFKGCHGIATQTIKWDIVAAVCVERLPVVTPPLNKLGKEYKEMLTTIELEKSMKSDHEIRHANDLIYMEKLKKNAANVDMDEISTITAQDFEDASTDELANFKVASIITDADKANDQTSLERNLQKHLILLVEQKIGSENKFIFPQGKHSDGETLRQTAERVLKDSCGEEINAQIYGNAPMGFYKYKYPSEQNGKSGAKVFFYYSRHRGGQVKKEAQYKWLNRKELETALPQSYLSSVSNFLIEE